MQSNRISVKILDKYLVSVIITLVQNRFLKNSYFGQQNGYFKVQISPGSFELPLFKGILRPGSVLVASLFWTAK